MKEDCFHLGIKAVICNKHGKLLLLKINPASLKDYAGPEYWDLPGGRMQCGATVEETLMREVYEETGIPKVHIISPLVMVMSKIRITPEIGLILQLFLCDIQTTRNIKISNEHLDYNWFTPLEAASLLTEKYPKEATDAISALVSS